ncbi:LOW QUALITY PROTEIN: hypothetical protein HZS_5824 [Henneguya salminicola]|nr:LOW QUALITY PROTEIN: hypothetical protein HZS_5824 [Henneguya salminicola]
MQDKQIVILSVTALTYVSNFLIICTIVDGSRKTVELDDGVKVKRKVQQLTDNTKQIFMESSTTGQKIHC